MSRKIAREAAMKLIYQMDLKDEFTHEAVESFVQNNKLKKDEISYIVNTANMIIDNLEKIDDYIGKYAHKWKLERLAKVDLAVLRIAICEIMFREDIPIEVSINEAVEISKKYSTEESSKFVNGILGGYVKEMEDRNG
ncbi:transcription antitermination factor NusB [Thermohalobacter berrensis]|uniref:Transcription antitermination protein NusB n=1 Tax=Thermohalobacter berrensis TaxID=99594 RepID=A0A419TAQ9_9FIRM|nr:transcription antitermination factor NusB [Thermohalobacter berrensis]RKD34568.1 transcription antitermination factor NusB [Thermohalobacter berrensis]